MDKKNAMRRAKRQSKVLEDNFWDCSVCTYRNTAEAFKCLMCDVRKGTSTRKPRMNQALVAQQQAGATGPGGPNSAGSVVPNSNTSSNSGKRRAGSGSGKANSGGSASSRRRSGGPPRFRDIDRSSGQTREVTVNSVTVVITEYRRRTPANVAAAATSDESSDARP